MLIWTCIARRSNWMTRTTLALLFITTPSSLTRLHHLFSSANINLYARAKREIKWNEIKEKHLKYLRVTRVHKSKQHSQFLWVFLYFLWLICVCVFRSLHCCRLFCSSLFCFFFVLCSIHRFSSQSAYFDVLVWPQPYITHHFLFSACALNV